MSDISVGDSGGGFPWMQGLNTLGTLGAAGSDIWGTVQNVQNQLQARKVASTLADPRRVSNFASQLYQPLSDAALAQINRGLNANLAMRGIAQGQYPNSLVANALARTEAERRGQAMQAALASLGGVAGAQPPYQPTAQLGQNLQAQQMLRVLRSMTGGGQEPGIARLPVPVGNDYQLQPPAGYGDVGTMY